MIRHFTRQGTLHARQGVANQDALYGYSDRDYIVITAADGVSAARHGSEGAEIACATAFEMFLRYADRLFDFERRKLAYLLLEQILYEIEQRAGGGDVCEYASTLMGAFVRKKDGAALLLNLGDGCVRHAGGGQALLELPPRRYGGQPCQTTTQEAYRAMEIRTCRLQCGDSVLLMTDGILEAASGQPALMRAACGGDFEQMKRISQALECRDDASWIALQYRG